jgi:DNA-binding PucR family transcriptional regulator
MTVLRRRSEAYVRYADVALLAAGLRDDLLADALHGIYLTPLDEEQDGGEVLRRTLRAYFAAGRNITSAASALGVTRQTVSGRLRTFESRVGRLLDDCALDADLAIRLHDITTAC